MSKPFFAHELALVESSDVGEGTRVWPFAHVMAGAVVGSDCNIGEGVFIEEGAVLGDRVTVKNHSLIWHGVHIGDDVFIGPNVVFTNDLMPRVRFKTGPNEWLETVVEDGASIGANSTILCGIRIGRHAMIGAGSVVTRTVSPHALCYGNPARRHGWVCECGQVLSETLVCSCGRSYSLDDGGLRSC